MIKKCKVKCEWSVFISNVSDYYCLTLGGLSIATRGGGGGGGGDDYIPILL